MADFILPQFVRDTGVESASPFCAKVHRALAFKGIKYKTHVVGSPAEMKRINPGVGKVPVLEFDGQMIADSTRIIDWLELHQPAPALRPADPRLAALDRLLEDQADEGLYWFAVYMRWLVPGNFAPFAKRAFGKLPPLVRNLVPVLARKTVVKQMHGQGMGRLPLERVLADFDRQLNNLEALLSDAPFLLGDQLYACDLAVFGPLRQLAMPTLVESAERVRRRPILLAWLKRVDAATTGPQTVPFD